MITNAVVRPARCVAALLAMLPAAAVALDNPLRVDLRGSQSHLREAAATVFGAGSSVLVDVTRYRGVPDGSAVTLDSGTCEHPGRIVYTLAPFATHGSITQLSHSLAEVAARAHSMIIHQTSSNTSPALACGKIID